MQSSLAEARLARPRRRIWPGWAVGCCCWTGRGGSSRVAGRSHPGWCGISVSPIICSWRGPAGRRIVSPTDKVADMPIDGGYVGMVDRDEFDEWLRARAAGSRAERRTGTYERISHDPDGVAVVHYLPKDSTEEQRVRTRVVVGADGARSKVAKQSVPGAERMPYVFAYHEIVRAPKGDAAFDGSRCDVYYQGKLSPDFYAWIFPHGDTMSIGTGSASKGFGLRPAIAALRQTTGLDSWRRCGTRVPLSP